MKYVVTPQPTILKFDIQWEDPQVAVEEYFCIAGKCLSGSRHYSEDFYDYKDACKAFDEYCGLVTYFGGGVVDLYCFTNDEFEIIKSKVCF
jgi:hypothetical protein